MRSAIPYHPEGECQKVLATLGIDNEIRNGVLEINRTSMANSCPNHSETAAYQTVLELLRDQCQEYYIFFCSRTDEYYSLTFKKKN